MTLLNVLQLMTHRISDSYLLRLSKVSNTYTLGYQVSANRYILETAYAGYNGSYKEKGTLSKSLSALYCAKYKPG